MSHALSSTASPPARGFTPPRLAPLAIAWATVAVIGQGLFAFYVAAFYGLSAWRGEWERWNEVFPRGHLPGDTVGNAMVAIHILLAMVLMIGGPLQLLPALRRRLPRLHRLNGRVFASAAVIAALAGLYLVWIRGGTTGDLVSHLGISLNAVAILGCAALAVHHARARRVVVHRRWAIRLFLVVNGVWFFRVGLMAWLLVMQGPVGFDPATFTGPFLIVLGFAQTLLPLAVAELYFRAQAAESAAPARAALRWTAAAVLLSATAVTALGVFGASAGMWLPRILS